MTSNANHASDSFLLDGETVEVHSREYQLEMLNESLQKNIIVVVSTLPHLLNELIQD